MKHLLSAITVIILGMAVCYADNPIVQTRYSADPAPMVYKDTVYVYTGHDEDKSSYFTMNDWRIFSSKDMVNWMDCGSPLSYKTFSWARGDAWAGQCIERNGKFYWYVPVGKINGGMVIGVAVADSPTGPFKDPLGHPLVEDGWGSIDPTVFIDDNGQAYLYWGNPELKYVKLNKDMISYDTSTGVVKVPLTEAGFGIRNNDPNRATLYEEGPWFYKRSGLYYMLYSASGIPENIAYATSSTPTGPWTYKGIIMPPQGSSFTNHCGVVDFKGNSYFFYHNGALPGGGGFTRSVCIEQFTYGNNGAFPTIKMSSQGILKGIGHLNPYNRTNAATIAWESGIKTDTGNLPPPEGVYVTSIDNGDYIKVNAVDFGTGARKFIARVASASKGGKIEVHLDKLDGQVAGVCTVPPTNGWQNWVTSSCKIQNAAGIHDLYFKFIGEDGPLFNFNCWRFIGTAPEHKPVMRRH